MNRSAIRVLSGCRAGVYADQAIGISTDEFTRAQDSGLRFLHNVFPLIDLRFNRAKCLEYLAERGFGVRFPR